MIWHIEDQDDALRRHLSGELQSACTMDPELLEEASMAVLQFFGETAYVQPLPSSLLVLVVSRILWGLGCEQEAQTYLRSHFPEHEALPLVAPYLVPTAGRADACWQILDSCLISLKEWQFLNGVPCWTVDLSRLVQPQEQVLEMEWLNRLKAVVAFLCPAWEGQDGRLSLGLKGVGPAGIRRFAPELLHFCRQLLAQTGENQNWGQVPEVIITDLHWASA